MLFPFEAAALRELNPAQGVKPLDVGAEGVSASISPQGRVIALQRYHPEHGILTLTSAPPFPDEQRYNANAVREYRQSLVTLKGFGLTFTDAITERRWYLLHDQLPFLRLTFADATIAECLTWIHTDSLQQQWRFSRAGVEAHVTGNLWLQRAAYTQLTEGGIVPMPPVATHIHERRDATTVLYNPHLDAKAYIHGATLEEAGDGVRFVESQMQTLGTGYDVVISFCTDVSVAELPTIAAPPTSSLLLNRAHTYAEVCAVPTHNNGLCILADHMILPLSWNRDAYYVMQILPLDQQWRYLRWLFRQTWRGTYLRSRAKPLSQAWGRSYMANGMPKDNRAYQLDQQIFPLLAACDVLDKAATACPAWLRAGVQTTLAALADVEQDGLYPTDETPADDVLSLPYHFSSHALLWYTLRRLQQTFADDVAMQAQIDTFAPDALRHRIHDLFTVAHDDTRIYAYAIDAAGAQYRYHDANDIPLVMLPLWGFCPVDDPVWNATIDFAWSAANTGAFAGRLGSVHTPAPWTLGAIQALIACKATDDRDRYQQVWQQLEQAAQWDGALPEAYSATDGSVVSRHWFAWTNAMLAFADSIQWTWEPEFT